MQYVKGQCESSCWEFARPVCGGAETACACHADPDPSSCDVEWYERVYDATTKLCRSDCWDGPRGACTDIDFHVKIPATADEQRIAGETAYDVYGALVGFAPKASPIKTSAFICFAQ